jgi:hypothetical protein
MEDPIRFDVYGRASDNNIDATTKMLMKSSAYPSELSARKAANHSRMEGSHILLASAQTWTAVQVLMASSGPFNELKIMQEGYGPADETSFCTEHKLFYGGCLECHVCSGFYAK